MKKIVLKKVAKVLTVEGSTVFTGDNDPQLIADAIPFALKTYESLLEAMPENSDLLYTTGKSFCMYAYAFVHTPADTISDRSIQEKTDQMIRAKHLYLRAKKYLLRAIEIQYPGFNDLLQAHKTDSALSLLSKRDSSLLYWTGASWMGAFVTDKFDMKIALDMPKAVACMKRLLVLNESYGRGSVHDFFISYYGSMPESMGGNEEKARFHFSRSIELSNGTSVSAFIALATSISVANQDLKEFQKLLTQAIAIPIDQDIPLRLANTIGQKKAQWLLDHRENFFLDDVAEEDDVNNKNKPESHTTKDIE